MGRELRIQFDKPQFLDWLKRGDEEEDPVTKVKLHAAKEELGFSGFDEVDEEAMRVLSRDGRDITEVWESLETLEEWLEKVKQEGDQPDPSRWPVSLVYPVVNKLRFGGAITDSTNKLAGSTKLGIWDLGCGTDSMRQPEEGTAGTTPGCEDGGDASGDSGARCLADVASCSSHSTAYSPG
eukprot:gene51920-9220_t